MGVSPEFAEAWDKFKRLLVAHGSRLRLIDFAGAVGEGYKSNLYTAAFEKTFDGQIGQIREGLKKRQLDGKPGLWDRDGFKEQFEAIVTELKRSHPEFTNAGCYPANIKPRRALSVRSPRNPDGPDFDVVWKKLEAFCQKKSLTLSGDIGVTDGGRHIGRSYLRRVGSGTFDANLATIHENAVRHGIKPEGPITFEIRDKSRYTGVGRNKVTQQYTMSLNEILAELRVAHQQWRGL